MAIEDMINYSSKALTAINKLQANQKSFSTYLFIQLK